MAEIVCKRQRFGQVLIELEPPGKSTCDLGDFERMGQPGAIMVAFVEDENLRLVLEATECGGMDDAVAIAAERAAAFARRLGVKPAPAPFRVARIGRTGDGRIHWCCSLDRRLTFASTALNYRG